MRGALLVRAARHCLYKPWSRGGCGATGARTWLASLTTFMAKFLTVSLKVAENSSIWRSGLPLRSSLIMRTESEAKASVCNRPEQATRVTPLTRHTVLPNTNRRTHTHARRRAHAHTLPDQFGCCEPGDYATKELEGGEGGSRRWCKDGVSRAVACATCMRI